MSFIFSAGDRGPDRETGARGPDLGLDPSPETMSATEAGQNRPGVRGQTRGTATMTAAGMKKKTVTAGRGQDRDPAPGADPSPVPAAGPGPVPRIAEMKIKRN